MGKLASQHTPAGTKDDAARGARQRRRTRRARAAVKAAPSEDEIERELLAAGVIDQAPPPITDLRPYQNRRLVKARGPQTVSERLIAERR